MESLSTLALVGIFSGGAIATWIAGVYLSRTTDVLDFRWKFGEALGGMILLSAAGSLPEVAITISAAAQHNLPLAAGNLIGGIAMQTMVLAICDMFVKGKKPLSYLVGSLMPVLEASLVVAIVAIVFMGAMLPASVAVFGVSPASILIVMLWALGIAMLNKVRNSPGWEITMQGSKSGRPHRRIPHPKVHHPYEKWSTTRIFLLFLAGSIVTLAAGVALAQSSAVLADRFHINGIVFGATILAAASALPEISTGIAAVRLGDHQLVMSDVFGGNAFQVCLFVLADIIAGTPALPQSGVENGWLAAVGILLTTLYASSVVMRPAKRYLRLGLDSVVAILAFVVGIVGLMLIAH
ncbi:MAG: sodium:calcium antiporter [Thermodesulfobacteriota bacterium]|jgi:cation:H+ antiporter